jgi:hypothetical protein
MTESYVADEQTRAPYGQYERDSLGCVSTRRGGTDEELTITRSVIRLFGLGTQ